MRLDTFDYLTSTSFTYRIILPEVLNLNYVARKAAEFGHSESPCDINFLRVGRYHHGIRFYYQEIAADISIGGQRLLSLYEGIEKPLSPLTLSPAQSIREQQNPDQIEYDQGKFLDFLTPYLK